MNCPFCGTSDTRVIDSRVAATGDSVRRRRECQACAKRFTTFEYIEKIEMMVVKRSGAREPFVLGKVRSGIERACEKRPVAPADIERALKSLERDLLQLPDAEVTTEEIGKRVLRLLRDMDHVAYLRFASVYKQFLDLHDFNLEIQSLLKMDPPHGGEPAAR